MSQAGSDAIESGWSLSLRLDTASRPRIDPAEILTAYHRFAIQKAVLHPASEGRSARIMLHLEVVQSQDGLASCVGMMTFRAHWLSWLDPDFRERALLRGRSEDQLRAEQERDQGGLKGLLIATGLSSGGSDCLDRGLGSDDLVGQRFVAFHECAAHEPETHRWYGPYFTYVAPRNAEDALAGRLPAPRLYNEGRFVCACGRAVGASTVALFGRSC